MKVNDWFYLRALRVRYLITTVLLCPLGLHVPWPRDRWHPERCAYCGRSVSHE